MKTTSVCDTNHLWINSNGKFNLIANDFVMKARTKVLMLTYASFLMSLKPLYRTSPW